MSPYTGNSNHAGIKSTKAAHAHRDTDCHRGHGERVVCFQHNVNVLLASSCVCRWALAQQTEQQHDEGEKHVSLHRERCCGSMKPLGRVKCTGKKGLKISQAAIQFLNYGATQRLVSHFTHVLLRTRCCHLATGCSHCTPRCSSRL